MPCYEYKCSKCEYVETVYESFAAHSLRTYLTCKRCGHRSYQVFWAPGVDWSRAGGKPSDGDDDVPPDEYVPRPGEIKFPRRD